MIKLSNEKIVDVSTVIISGIDMQDYPQFCDAYVIEAFDVNGDKLSDSELDELTENYSGLINELAHEQRR